MKAARSAGKNADVNPTRSRKPANSTIGLRSRDTSNEGDALNAPPSSRVRSSEPSGSQFPASVVKKHQSTSHGQGKNEQNHLRKPRLTVNQDHRCGKNNDKDVVDFIQYPSL